MRIDLIRSFSTASDENEDPEDWLRYFRYVRKGKGQYNWSDLPRCRWTCCAAASSSSRRRPNSQADRSCPRRKFRFRRGSPSLDAVRLEAAEVARLVGSAVFDEATFGRVKFHHRSIREYLAACWVNRQFRLGLPLHRVLPLFSAAPFGIAVLIPSRRATLCWLAALNVEVREWVTREFPEMLLFEGDPEAWDLVTANLAFTAYVERVKTGLRTDWWNAASEFRRLARRLPPGRVAGLLTEQQPNSRVITALLPLVMHGRLLDCGQVVFDLYQRPPRERQDTLVTLSAIATPEHRASIKEDLLQGRLQSNELIAAALVAVDWTTLTVAELVQV